MELIFLSDLAFPLFERQVLMLDISIIKRIILGRQNQGNREREMNIWGDINFSQGKKQQTNLSAYFHFGNHGNQN